MTIQQFRDILQFESIYLHDTAEHIKANKGIVEEERYDGIAHSARRIADSFNKLLGNKVIQIDIPE